MSLTLITPPAWMAISLDDLKKHARITISDDDDYLYTLATAAIRWVENYIRGALITQTWDWKMDCGFPASVVNAGWIMPRSPLASVTHIKYVDADGAEQTLSASVYTVDAASRPGRVVLAFDQQWPTTRDVINNVTIRFVCGYGNPAAIPRDIRQALLILASHWYEHREPLITGTIIGNVPMSVQSILAQYKKWF